MNHFLFIIGLALFWYALVPLAGSFISRRIWRVFRERFNGLRLRPFLDYAGCRRADGETYRFIGGVEAVEEAVLWVRSETLTVPVLLEGAKTYMLPTPERDGDWGAAPEKIRWNQVTALTEGAKVFVGGPLVRRGPRRLFASTAQQPLLIIFYDGPDRSLGLRAVGARRHKNEYWNALTPYAFTCGAFSLLMVAMSFLSRPAFRLTMITAFFALFIPLFPFFPPGVLLTLLYRQLWWQGRLFRVYQDLVMAPLCYVPQAQGSGAAPWECRLPDGERYGAAYLSQEALQRCRIPLIIPESPVKDWYVFGALRTEEAGRQALAEPQDPFALFGAVPGKPAALASRYRRKALVLELVSCAVFLGGIGLNILFIWFAILLFV
ncbi:MAG: hypothetical protein LBD13_02100 [Spirochaetaceae bacterium]|nr:hypothetical protein [Spirochaetaceae bacterium]